MEQDGTAHLAKLMSATPPPQSITDTAHADVGIVCALYLEIAPLLDKCEKLRRLSGAFTVRGGRFQGRKIAVRRPRPDEQNGNLQLIEMGAGAIDFGEF